MHCLISYNLSASEVSAKNWKKLFENQRRNATFAGVFEDSTRFYLIRDHLGIVPLFYRIDEVQPEFGFDLDSIVKPTDTVNTQGVFSYLSFMTCKILPLLDQVEIVPPGSVLSIHKKTKKVSHLYQYRLNPKKVKFKNYQDCLEKLDTILSTAVSRIAITKHAGVFLSGGIDSALLGKRLKQPGVSLDAYTSAPWGKSSSEIDFAKINAREIGVTTHSFDYLKSQKYSLYSSKMPSAYGMPHGSMTAIGVLSLIDACEIKHEKVVYFGQNSDTLSATVEAQVLTYLSNFVPLLFRKLAGKFYYSKQVTNYTIFLNGKLTVVAIPSHISLLVQDKNRLREITKLGIFIGHTPSDSEVILQPLLKKRIIVLNPYYDVDLIEFYLSVPLVYRLKIHSKVPFLTLEKRLFRDIAIKYLPKKLVERKKAFSIPTNRDKSSKQFIDSLPTHFNHIKLKSEEQRFALYQLKLWLDKHKISHSMSDYS